jgi:hypothetical protein
MTYRSGAVTSDSVNLGSNPSPPATRNADETGASGNPSPAERSEISEQTADTGSTIVGTATPGPWHITPLGGWTPWEGAIEVAVHRSGINDTICWTPSGGNEQADAQLIAAAPDLLMALAWLVGIKDRRPTDYEEQKVLAWAAARAAIAKAEGRA